MNRRNLILGSLALGLAACTPGTSEAAQPPFQPTRFSVQVRGTGPDVVLIPGLTAGRDVWASTVAAVPGYRYHLIQVGGFAGEPVRGNARANAGGAIVAPIADEIGRYISTRHLRPALVGHSMGGTLAMMVAARAPDHVGKVMVVDMLPQPAGLLGASASGLGPLAQSLRDIVATPGGRDLFASLVSSFGNNRGPDGRSDPDVVGRAMHDLAGIDLTGQLGRIRAPMTVVYAAPDARYRAQADQTYRTAYAARRGAQLVRIDGSGHMIMFDQPRAFQAQLRTFLER